MAETNEQIAGEILEAEVAEVTDARKAFYADYLAAVQEMQNPKPSGHNTYDDYSYSTLGDYLDTINAATRAHGLLVICVETNREYYATSSAKMPNGCRVTIEATVLHAPTGEQLSIEAIGEGWDRGDKAGYKAFTGARKYALQGLFGLYGGDDPERESAPVEAQQKPPQQRPRAMRQGPAQQAPPQPTQEPSPASQTPSQIPPVPESGPTFENYAAWIGNQATPEELLAFVNRAAKGSRLLANLPLRERVIKRAGEEAFLRVQRKEWTEDQVEAIEERVAIVLYETGESKPVAAPAVEPQPEIEPPDLDNVPEPPAGPQTQQGLDL